MIRRLFPLLTFTIFLSLLCATAWAQMAVVPSGTEIKVRTDQQIQASAANAGRSYGGRIAESVTDSAGKVVIPRGAPAQLRAVSSSSTVGGEKVALDLSSVTVNGRRYMIESKGYKPGSVGANKTTAKYAGGGALAGALIGGLAGGGKGALIGTLAGGAAGAGAQTLTQGKNINVPAETVLTFKTAQELQMRPVSGTARRQ